MFGSQLVGDVKISTKDVIFALGTPALNAKEHSSIDAHKAKNTLCFMRIPFGCQIYKFNCKFGFKFKRSQVEFSNLILNLACDTK